MLTFFTTAKPFHGHDGIIQRNALTSWKLLHPGIEIILFGDEDGAAEVCAELGIRHERYVERFEGKYPYVNFMFARAQAIARHGFLCYSNCDIVLVSDFWRAFEKAIAWRKRFLVVAQRWDTDITRPLDFGDQNWTGKLRQFVVTEGTQQIPDYVDFFLFSRGLYEGIPALVVGYSYWDHWMVWKALSANAPILDASPYVVPVHQNHGYLTTPGRIKGSQTDLIAKRNLELAGDGKQLSSILDAQYVLSRYGRIYWSPFHRRAHSEGVQKIVNRFLIATFGFRRILGLRRDTVDKLFQSKIGSHR
jgi:hypothetical protein